MITYQTRYGISLAQFENLKNLQGNKCAICKLGETQKDIQDSVRQLCIDHDHSNGKVRELLCSSCNIILGKVKDSIKILETMIQYLKKHRSSYENTVD